MTVLEQLKSLSKPEALVAMETPWNHLLELDDEPQSPNWHGEELARRDKLIEAGDATFSNWDEAKQRILDRANDH